MIVDSVVSCIADGLAISLLIIAVMFMAAMVVAGLMFVAPPYGTDEQHSWPIQNDVSCWLGFGLLAVSTVKRIAPVARKFSAKCV